MVARNADKNEAKNGEGAQLMANVSPDQVALLSSWLADLDQNREAETAPAPSNAQTDDARAGDSRDKRGRFAPGNRCGRGNPAHRRMAHLRRECLKTISAEDVREITRKLITSAKAGDLLATRLLFEYALGKPMQPLELSGPEGSPIDVAAVQHETVDRIISHLPPPCLEVLIADIRAGKADRPVIHYSGNSCALGCCPSTVGAAAVEQAPCDGQPQTPNPDRQHHDG